MLLRRWICAISVIFGAASFQLACGNESGPADPDTQVTCASGQTKCGKICVDLNSDGNNCGACTTTCTAALVCSQGSCQDSCGATETQCDRSCVQLTGNVAHCGECDHVCSTGSTCAFGVCECPAGELACGETCANTSADPSNCGSCGHICAVGESCLAGNCNSAPAGAGGGSGLGTGGGSGLGTGGADTGGSGGVDGGGGADGSGGMNTGSGGMPGACDPGNETTTWATGCATSAQSCTAGGWTDGGPEPTNSSMSKCFESDHFVVYSNDCVGNSAAAQTGAAHLETIWKVYFGSPMYMREPYCSSSKKYKSVVHVKSDFGLSGGAWDLAPGDTHMGMWIGPEALNDHWGLAHEFMHGVQSVQGGQRCNQSNTCGWIYESHANWAAQQQTEYHTTEVHCSEMLANMPHLYLGSSRDRYCNWQFMEYLKDKYCFEAVNAIWTGDPAIDPLTAIRNGMDWSVADMNDFMGEWAMHNVTWDYQDPVPQSTAGKNQGSLFRSKYGITTDTSQTIRRLRTTKVEPLALDYATTRRFISPYDWAPQRYGYNVIRLHPEDGASTVTVNFRGVTSSPSSPDWRYGLVATDGGITRPRYSELQAGSDGSLSFCVTPGDELFLVVMATPSAWYNIVWDQPYSTVPRYPYMFELAGAWPEGFKNGTQDACPSGLTRATNGGGCAPSGTSAYVGPYATVLSGATVSGSARIEDHAVVANGTVSGGTVGALTLVGSSGGFGSNAFTISSGTAMTTFYPLGFFESGQGLSGGLLTGDVEYRGSGLSRNSGNCSGFVDTSTCVAPGSDATPAPPYSWR